MYFTHPVLRPLAEQFSTDVFHLSRYASAGRIFLYGRISLFSFYIRNLKHSITSAPAEHPSNSTATTDVTTKTRKPIKKTHMEDLTIIGLRDQLLSEQAKLEHVINKTRKELLNSPEGYLRISSSQGRMQYYHLTEDKPRNGTYLQKNNIDFVKRLAQKSYDKKLLKYAEKTHSQITRLLNIYHDDKIESLYLAESLERQKLITPVEELFEQKLQTWLAQPYTGKGFNDGSPIILTNNGLRVRSKSEKIMADYFDSIGLEYKYECPLTIKQHGIIYPDFTFLSRRTGQEIYWEHEGMMDNPDYSQSAVRKIELYEKNDIFPGENLILTFETSSKVLDISLMKSLVKRYLLT